MKLYKIKYRYQAEEYVFVEASEKVNAIEIIQQHFKDNPGFELVDISETTREEMGFALDTPNEEIPKEALN